MADAKLTAQTETTAPASTDIAYVVINPGGTPASRKATLANVRKAANPMSQAGDVIIGGTSGAETRLAIGTANQVLRVNAGATAPEWASVGRVLISESTPSAVNSVDIQSIAATYRSLLIEIVGRSTASANSDNLSMFYNNDTTATNYRNSLLQWYATSTIGLTQQNNAYIASLPAANALANVGAAVRIHIPQYAGTTFYKQALARDGYLFDASSVYTIGEQYVHGWGNTAAINRITLTLTSGNFVSGSTVRLWGEY